MEKTVPESEAQLLACEVCMSEIPASVAHSLEGPDYVHHFCGLECYARWTRDPDAPAAPAGGVEDRKKSG